MTHRPAYLVRGDDATLLGRAVRDLVGRLAGDEDRSLVVADMAEAAYRKDSGDFVVDPIVDAAQTPPFLTTKRVVVARELGRFTSRDDVAPLVRYLADPLDTTALVLVWEKAPDATRLGAVPKSLVEAVEEVGEVIDTKVGRGKAASGWIQEQVALSGVRLDAAAIRALETHLGEDLSRLPAILDTLASAFGGGAALGVSDVAPYLGEAGDVAPWELTDAIAAGDVATALDRLDRMQQAGSRHPIQILASLHAHHARLLRLDGSGARDERGAAALLGMKGSTFPAKKALQQAQAMGGSRIRRSIELLARADLDIRGASANPPEATMEVLVARLARLSR